MCGITGWIDWDGVGDEHAHVVTNMTRTLIPRGPDDGALWRMPKGVLGHRRLSIIDPTHGQQPLVRTIVGVPRAIVYNGELYNASELRRTLEQRGHRFMTACDTEVVLVSCIEWGADAPKKLDGIFAYAYWDGTALTLCRDRLGVKPLFYSSLPRGIVFASEQKALLCHPDITSFVDASGFAQLCALGPARTPGNAIFRDMSEVRPGATIQFRPDGFVHQTYWTLPVRAHTDDEQTTIETVHALLHNAVQKQLVSDVPLGCLLSGGLDSSAIAQIASAHTPIDTFSVSYVGDDATHGDAPFIALMAAHIHSTHTSTTVSSAQLFDALIPALYARDVPGMADIDASLYAFCADIRTRVTVALSGEGADELFGGYPWCTRAVPSGAYPWAPHPGLHLIAPDVRRQLQLDAYVQADVQRAHNEVAYAPGEQGTPAGEDRLRTHLNLTRFLPTLLERKDRMSMAHGLEVRVPFCDHHLIEYVYNVPYAMKAQAGPQKGLLKKALAHTLPAPIISRPKTPYPKTRDATYARAVRQAMEHVLHERTAPLCALIDCDATADLVRTPPHAASQPWFGQLMSETQRIAYLWQLHVWLTSYRVRV
ncbi:MAG: asparagine synthase (glutamine-hydrolyzing) [Paenibacillaceae bacterium]|nr:asparagine synthase (glutamine-hydrolyzing) [Paenibacillaceae bacterium]